jgi:hypothetical protein
MPYSWVINKGIMTIYWLDIITPLLAFQLEDS